MSRHFYFGLEDFNVISKTRSYEIHFHPGLWNQIKGIVAAFRAGGAWKKSKAGTPYWIAPSDEVKLAQERIAWAAQNFIRAKLAGAIELKVEAFGTQDADNLLKILMDGLQDSGVIKNDRQVCKITIERHYGAKQRGFRCEVIEL